MLYAYMPNGHFRKRSIMRRVRICHLITDLAPAGAERCVFELARRLDKRRFEVEVAALRGGAVAGWLSQAGVPTTVLGVRGKWDALKLGGLVDLFRRRRIDIVHTHLFHADLAGRAAAWLGGSARLVHTVHVAEARFRPWQFAFARLAADRCDRIIAVSVSARDHHARHSGLPHSRYVVISNGIDPAAYSRDEASRLRLRRLWGVGGDEVLLAFVGRLDVQKGIDVLLKTMRLLAERGRAPKLVIAGDGPLRAMVQELAPGGPLAGAVRVLGFTDDVRGVLSAADIAVMPSRWEGWGLAAGEAMAASLPLIATHVAGLKDVAVDGQTALFVEKEDIAGLGRCVERLARDADLRRRLGQAGRQRVVRHFHIAKTVAAHEALYLQLVGQKND
jgi:glycosyltransferase involved in cell wall biosynthesis